MEGALDVETFESALFCLDRGEEVTGALVRACSLGAATEVGSEKLEDDVLAEETVLAVELLLI